MGIRFCGGNYPKKIGLVGKQIDRKEGRRSPGPNRKKIVLDLHTA